MQKSQARLVFIFITIMLDMIGVGLIIPSLPDIMRRFTNDPAQVSAYFGYFIALYACMQFLASPLLGSLSDLIGRRPILLVSLCIAGLDYILMAFAPTLSILFVGRVVSGLTGASLTVAMAYISDISSDKNRAANFGMIGAAFGLGFVIGPAIGGLLGQMGPQYPFLAAAGMNLLNFLFGIFVLPESFPAEKRRGFNWNKLNPFLSLKKIFSMPNILILAAVHFLMQLAGQTHPSIWTLYTEYKFGWTRAQVGLSLATVGILVAIAQGWLTRVLIPKFGERRTVLYGTFGSALAFCGFALATQGWMMYAILISSAIFWTAQPALQSLISQKAPANEQGELQGALVGLSSLGSIINPIICTQLFAFFTQSDRNIILPGAPYFFAALISLFSWFILARQRV